MQKDKQAERTAKIRQAHALLAQHQIKVKRAALTLDAESRWTKTLDKHDRQNREFVLLALQSERVPRQLGWSYSGFDQNYRRDSAIRMDREIFMQRLELQEFEDWYKNRAYRVPQEFRNDKHVMLKIVAKNPLALSYASNELKDDRELVLAALKSKQECAPKAIQYASKKLRGQRSIIRAVLRHGHGIKALKLLPRKVRDDYDLILLAVKSSNEECNKSYEILKELSEEMLDEPDIVYEAVKHRGSNIRFVKNLLVLEDESIISAACKNGGAAAVQHVEEGYTRDRMLRGDNLRQILEDGGHEVLDELEDDIVFDPEYLIPAVENGCVLSAQTMDILFKEDRNLFDMVLLHSNNPFEQFHEIPEEFRVAHPLIGVEVLRKNKSIQQDQDSLAFHISIDITDDSVLRKHITCLMDVCIARNAQSASPRSDVLTDKAVVISLCKYNGDYYRQASTALKADLDVVRATFSSSVSSATIKLVSKEVFENHHDIAVLAIRNCRPGQLLEWRNQENIMDAIGKDLLKQSEVMMLEWMRKGWSPRGLFYWHERLRGKTVPIEAIKHWKDDGHYGWRSLFRMLPYGVLKDKDFMVSAVEANPIMLKKAHKKLRTDVDFMSRIVCQGREALKEIAHTDDEFHTLVECADQVRGKLPVSDAFIVQFLGGIAIAPHESSRVKRRRKCRGPEPCCHLRMLDALGPEGATVKRVIAEYAGVPVGQELKNLRTALDTLEFWGY